MKLNILVAEDNFFTAQQYLSILKKNGHNVTISGDGKECLKKYYANKKNANNNKFDVVLLDNNMPNKTGSEVAIEILKEFPDQRIVFASAYNVDSLSNFPKGLKESVEILQKPFSLSDLLKKIELVN